MFRWLKSLRKKMASSAAFAKERLEIGNPSSKNIPNAALTIRPKVKILIAMVPLFGVAAVLGVIAFYQPGLGLGSALIALETALGVLSICLIWPRGKTKASERKA